MPARPGQPCHGRLYARNLPLEMTEKDVSEWINGLCLPRPSSVYLLKKGIDVRSAYLHYTKSTPGQLESWAEHLSGHWLSHKPTEVIVALDGPQKRTAAPWLKKMVLYHHSGSCQGRGRRRESLFYHGFIRDPNGELQRKECQCCIQPWPPCRACFVS